MRLLDTLTLELKLFPDPVPEDVPYAILSHTWGDDEVTFDDMRDLCIAKTKSGFVKIQATCEMAVEYGLAYVWVDTCCIDKSSSAELSEAINSMFRWYKHSTVCFAFLSDLPKGSQITGSSAFGGCKWFTRGWTLQELIAPTNLVFFDEDWNIVGTKLDLGAEVESITGISRWILDGSSSLLSIPLAKRMSWAAQRETTRVEDRAYCLLGIFDVNMPMIYGEGSRAFIRLQEEILRKTTDLSIFAWQAFDSGKTYRGILAESPAEFVGCGHIELSDDQFRFRDEISLTNRGVKIQTAVQYTTDGIFVMDLHCYNVAPPFMESKRLGIYLKRALDTYYRSSPHDTATARLASSTTLPRPIFLLSTADEVSTKLLATSSDNRHIRVQFPTDTPSYMVHNIRAVPETYWEAHERHFAIHDLTNFICFVRFSVTSRVLPAQQQYGMAKEETTSFILVCDLANRSDFRFIDPFTNIEDYGPIGDAYSLYLLRPGEIEDRSVSMMHKDDRHNYVVTASLGTIQAPSFLVEIGVSPPEEHGVVGPRGGYKRPRDEHQDPFHDRHRKARSVGA